MNVIVPQFISITTSASIQQGWKNICIIPTGTVTITNSLNPTQSMAITTVFMIGIGTPNIDFWESIIISGIAAVIINGYAQA